MILEFMSLSTLTKKALRHRQESPAAREVRRLSISQSLLPVTQSRYGVVRRMLPIGSRQTAAFHVGVDTFPKVPPESNRL